MACERPIMKSKARRCRGEACVKVVAVSRSVEPNLCLSKWRGIRKDRLRKVAVSALKFVRPRRVVAGELAGLDVRLAAVLNHAAPAFHAEGYQDVVVTGAGNA